MSDVNMDSVPGEGASDDLLSLLSTPVSKDYINCVWSNEPTESNQTEGPPAKPPEQAAEPTDGVLGDSQDSSKILHPEKDVKKTIKPPRKRNRSKQQKTLDAKSDQKVALKKTTIKLDKSESKLKEKNNLPASKDCSPLIKPADTSMTEEKKCAKPQSEKRKNSNARIRTVRHLQAIDSSQQKKMCAGNASEEISNAAAINEKCCPSNKSLTVSPALPPYAPKEVDSRFFSGNYFSCRACGDKYVLQTSLFAHMSRKTARFLYKCPCCKAQVSFFNQCTFLLHIMSHFIRSEDINPGDLEVTSLNAEEYDLGVLFRNTSFNYTKCTDCNRVVKSLKLHFQAKDLLHSYTGGHHRAQADEEFRCETCQLHLPTGCALAAHERYHRDEQPHICPECGEVFLRPSTLLSHMKENCLHNLKRSVEIVHLQCSLCSDVIPSKDLFIQHAVSRHMRQVFICNICGEFGNTLDSINFHRNLTHKLSEIIVNSDEFVLCVRFECDKCPGIFIRKESLGGHATFHFLDRKIVKTVFQCDACKVVLESHKHAIEHKVICLNGASQLPQSDVSSNVSQHEEPSSNEPMETSSISDNECALDICENDSHYDDIHSNLDSSLNGHDVVEKIDSENKSDKEVDPIPKEHLHSENHHFKQNAMCKLCKKKISIGVEKAAIKKHFLTDHFNIFMNAIHGKSNGKFPVQIVLTNSSENLARPVKKSNLKVKVNQVKSANGFPNQGLKKMAAKKKKRKDHKIDKSPLKIGTILRKVKETENVCYKCYKCPFASVDADVFKKHISTHKSNPSDLQCPECGLCFIVRPPLEKHLIVEHCIKTVDRYLIDHGFEEHVSDVEEQTEKMAVVDVETVEANQCKVCREKFDSVLLLEKHFRVHGGAFLLSKLKAQRAS